MEIKTILVPLIILFAVLACKKEDDAPENQSTDNSINFDCNDTSITYTGHIANIMNTECSFGGCHNSASSSGGVNLEGYDAVANEADRSRFLGAIKHQSGFSAMPRGRSKLSANDIALIECWINQGKKE